MAESKFDRFFNEIERAARWLHENDGIGSCSGKSICIFVHDGKKRTHSFMGTLDGLIALHEETGMVLKKALIKELLDELED